MRIEKKTLLIHAVFPYYTTRPQNRKGGCGKFRNASQMDGDKRDWDNRRGRRPPRPARPKGAGCRKSEIFGGPSGRPAPTVLFWFVGAIHESPADAEWHRNIPRHCEEPQGDVAIPWYKGRPENRRDCHVGLRPPRNDVHILGHPL